MHLQEKRERYQFQGVRAPGRGFGSRLMARGVTGELFTKACLPADGRVGERPGYSWDSMAVLVLPVSPDSAACRHREA